VFCMFSSIVAHPCDIALTRILMDLLDLVSVIYDVPISVCFLMCSVAAILRDY